MDILHIPPDQTFSTLLNNYNYHLALRYFLYNASIVLTALLWGAGLIGQLLNYSPSGAKSRIYLSSLSFFCISVGLALIIFTLFLLAWAKYLTPEGVVIAFSFISFIALASIYFNKKNISETIIPPCGFINNFTTFLLVLLLAAFQATAITSAGIGDCTSYHAPYADFLLKNLGLGVAPEHLIYPFHSLNINIFYSLGLMIQHDISYIQTMHALFATLSMFGIYAFCIETKQQRFIAILVPFLFVQIFTIRFSRFAANVDLGSMYFVLACIFALYLWADRKTLWLLVISAINFGMAIGAKYIICVFAIPVALYICIQERRSSMRPLLVFAAWGAIFGLYWYIRNFILTGNPVHPFATGLFGFYDWNEADMISQMQALSVERIPRNLLGILLMPWYAYLDEALNVQHIFYIICLLYFVTFFSWLAPRKINYLLLFSWIYVISWVYGSQDPRHIQPIIPLVCIHSGYLIKIFIDKLYLLLKKYSEKISGILATCFSCFCITIVFFYSGFYVQQLLPRIYYEPLEKTEANEMYLRGNPTYDLMEQANIIFNPNDTVYEFFNRDGRWFFKGNLVGNQYGANGYARILEEAVNDNGLPGYSPKNLQRVLEKKYGAVGFIFPNPDYFSYYSKDEFDKFFILEYSNKLGAIYRFRESK